MYNLVIDIGNTNSKLAVFNEKKEQVYYQRLQQLDETVLNGLLRTFPLQYFTMSSVRAALEPWIHFLEQKLVYVPFSTQVAAGVRNHYETPATLGQDRWAKIIAARHWYKGDTCLIIDMGTCITYDVLSSKGDYNGGSISPGIRMRFEALHTYTGKLPLVEWSLGQPVPEGTNTRYAISSGVLKGIGYEIAGFIAAENDKNKNLRVLLTGGDADFLIEQLKNSIFASQITHDPYLVLKGLNEVITLSHV